MEKEGHAPVQDVDRDENLFIFQFGAHCKIAEGPRHTGDCQGGGEQGNLGREGGRPLTQVEPTD